MYEAVNETYRSPINPATDGFIDIRVKTESGAIFTALYNDSLSAGSLSGPNTLLANFVNTQPFYWGSPSTYSWNTGAMNNSEYIYPEGTYSVWAESTLNDMKNNYKNGDGAVYTGKTISPVYTITLVPETVTIEANQDSVVRGQPFSVTIVGKPADRYCLWITGVSLT